LLIALVSGSGYLLLFPPLGPQISTCTVTYCSPPPISNSAIFAFIFAIIVGGFIGTLVDSILGHFEEKGIGNKYSSNFVCSVAGGILSVILYSLVFNFLI
jgi:hypothetical protein